MLNFPNVQLDIEPKDTLPKANTKNCKTLKRDNVFP